MPGRRRTTTSGLFVACTENVLLVLFLYTLLNGLMELVMPADFSPAMRGALISQLVLVIVTGALVLGISLWDRAREMGVVFFSAERKEEEPSEKNEVERWIMERMALCRWEWGCVSVPINIERILTRFFATAGLLCLCAAPTVPCPLDSCCCSLQSFCRRPLDWGWTHLLSIA